MLHGASPDEAVSARGLIAIRYWSPLRFSKELDFYRAVFFIFLPGTIFFNVVLKNKKNSGPELIRYPKVIIP